MKKSKFSTTDASLIDITAPLTNQAINNNAIFSDRILNLNWILNSENGWNNLNYNKSKILELYWNEPIMTIG